MVEDKSELLKLQFMGEGNDNTKITIALIGLISALGVALITTSPGLLNNIFSPTSDVPRTEEEIIPNTDPDKSGTISNQPISDTEKPIMDRPAPMEKTADLGQEYRLLVNTGTHKNARTCESITFRLQGESGKQVSHTIDGRDLIAAATSPVTFTDKIEIGRIKLIEVELVNIDNCNPGSINDWFCDWIKVKQPEPDGTMDKVVVKAWFGDSVEEARMNRTFQIL